MANPARTWHLPEDGGAPPGDLTRLQWAVLRSRGIRSLEALGALLDPATGPEHDPMALPGMGDAVARLREALERGEAIVVYGDYDADGVTSAALLTRALEAAGASVRAFIPSRFEEGYGLQQEALARLHAEGARLVVSVDCGVRAIGEVAFAQGLGLDVVVTDHHEPGESLPPALAVVNPKREDSAYPFRGLSGVGLAYKLARALTGGAPLGLDESHALAYLAVGTIADLAPLVDENRSLVARGLRALRESPPPGLLCLMEVARVTPARLTARDVAFGIGPRLNAAGRLGSAQDAYRLLVASSLREARPLAEALDQANRERQGQTQKLLERVTTKLDARAEAPALIFDADESYGEGLLGPAASKIVEEWHRPAVLVAIRGAEGRGSARSVAGFDITQALESCAPLLTRFGGHEAAAGFTVPVDRLSDLRARLEAVAEQGVEAPGRPPAIDIDAVVTPDEVNDELMDFLDRLEPFGVGFPPPLFACMGMTLMGSKPIGRDQAHLRLLLRHPSGAREGIAFRQGHRRPKSGARIDVAFYAERDRYQGVETIRWNVQSMRAAADG
jgi:single-stranded-DNA-specific exonuclease